MDYSTGRLRLPGAAPGGVAPPKEEKRYKKEKKKDKSVKRGRRESWKRSVNTALQNFDWKYSQ